MDDHALLRDFLEHRSEQAFAGLVARHLPVVYATALRLVRDPHTAQDVAQTVFIQLARKVRTVRDANALPGWLYRATQRAAFAQQRADARRHQRETEAMNLAESSTDTSRAWSQLAPLLDEALNRLNRDEQDAVLLRFFHGKNYREVASAIGANEDAARKRVDRSLEKMRQHFIRHGVTTTAALLGSAIGANAAAPLPAGLAVKVTGASLAGIASAGSVGFIGKLLEGIYMTKKTMLLYAACFAAVALMVSQRLEIADLQSQLATRPPTKRTSTARINTSGGVVSTGDTAPKISPAEVESKMAAIIKSRLWRSPAQWYRFLDQLGPDSLPQAIAYADSQGGSFRDILTASLLTRWAETDPVAAMSYAQGISGADAQKTAMQSVITSWIQSDPHAAVDWLQQLPAGPQRDELVTSATLTLAYTDPDAALQLVGPTGPVSGIFHTWTEDDPQGAISKAAQLPSGPQRTDAVKSIAEIWATRDMQATLDWAGKIADATDQSAALEGVLPKLADKNPQQAVDYVAALPPGDAQNKTMDRVLSQWAKSDSPAATNWVEALPQGNFQQQALQSLVTQLSRQNPAAAAPLADAIADDTSRARAIEMVARDWLKKDPQSAAAWVSQTNLSDEQRQKILGQQ